MVSPGLADHPRGAAAVQADAELPALRRTRDDAQSAMYERIRWVRAEVRRAIIAINDEAITDF